MKHILVDMPVDDEALERLKRIPGIAMCFIEPREEIRPLPVERLRQTHILFCTCLPANFAAMTALELIQICSSGYSELCGLGLAERGVRVCNGLGNMDVPIAEWNMAMMVNLARDLRSLIRHQDASIWDRAAVFQREIRGSVVGIWGYGGIGRETARLAKAYGMTVYVMTRDGIRPRAHTYHVPGTGDPDGVLPDRIFSLGQEEAFLRELDFLVLAMPLTARTEGIIGERELRALPPTAYILNPARGPLIKEEALLAALRHGWIAGGALDTHYRYPMPPDHPLWTQPNVIMTPHIAGSSLSPHFVERSWDIFVHNVERFMAGEPLLNELTAAQLQGD